MAFSAVGITKVKKEMDVSGEAEHAVTPPSPNSCNGYEPVMYSIETRDQRQSIYLQRHFPNQTQEGPLQSKRVLLNEASRGAGRATHDFLSLYGGIPSHFVEPNANRGASSSLTTQDLLQPLERGNSPKYQDSKSLHSNKPTKGESLSQHGSVAAPVPDHLLPNCVSSTPMNASMEVSQMQLLRLAGVGGNPQGIRCEPQMSLSASHDEHLLLESMRSSDLTVEQEYVETHKCWSKARAEYALPDLLYATKGSSNHGTLDGCYQPLPPLSRHWQKANQPFVELIKHSKVPSGDEEDEVEGLDHAKEQSEYTSMDGKSMDKRATTPRSKHSATEQRRRSKINDRFQMLRNLVPHSDQKRDKASFLLEVIQYVQVLQEKVRKYEGIEQGRHQERLNNLVWESCKKTAVPEAFVRDATAKDNTGRLKNITSKGLAVDVKPFTEIHDRRPRLLFSQSAHESGALPADLYPHVRQQSTPHINVRSAVITNEIDASPENYTSTRVIPKICSSLLSGQHDLQATVPAPDSQTICSLSRRCMDELPHLREESTSAIHVTEQSQAHFDAKHQRQSAVEPRGGRSAVSMDSLPVLENSVAPVNAIQGLSGGTFGSDEIQIRTTSHADSAVPNNKEEFIPHVLKNKMDTPATHIRDESLAVTGGIISVSSIYSQELLNALTHALQSSGLDLSQANISVQIDLGKRVGDSKTISSDEQTIRLTPESSSQSQQSNGHPRPAGPHSESNLPCKKPKVRDDWLG